MNRGRFIFYDGKKWNTLIDDEKIIPDIIEKAVGYSNNKDIKFREDFKENKKVLNRLDIIKKYTQKCDDEYIEDLKEEHENEEKDNRNKIKDCEQFGVLVEGRVKELIYNEKDVVINKKNLKVKKC